MKKLVHIILVVILASSIIFPTLGKVSLWDSDEGRYIICAQNAIEEGKWLIPEYNGKPRIVKPPLMVWLVAASSLIFNKGRVNEFSARLPSAIAAILTLIVVYLLALSLFKDETVALFSSLCLATALLFVKQARFCITDMVLLFFITTAIFSFFYSIENEKPQFTLIAFALMGFGFMDKGPVAFVVPVGVILLYTASEGKLRSFNAKWTLLGFLLFLTISLWWPIYVGKPYWEKFIFASNVKRFAHNPSWKTSMFFYFTNFPAHFLIWSATLPLTAWMLKNKREKGTILPLIWFAFVFVLFSMSDTKRSSYILPLYPAAAIITGWALAKLKEESRLNNWYRVSLYLLFAFLILAGVYSLYLVYHWSKDTKLLALMSSIYLLALAVIYISKKGKTAIFVSAAIIYAGLYTNLYQPVVDRVYHSPRRCMKRIKREIDHLPLYVWGSTRSNELYYLGLRKIEKIPQKIEGTSFFYTRKKKIPHIPNAKIEKVFTCRYLKHKLTLYRITPIKK